MLLTVRHLLDHRVLFFGGKGGVGKTTCASALALAASGAGKRVLLVSTDPAHSTSDIFERPFAREEREVLPGLTGLEMDAEFEARRYLGEVRERISTLFNPGVVREAMRQIDLVAGMPGLADVALFERMTDLVLNRTGAYDLIVFDTAPTGHTLRLLHMPEAMAAWVQALSDRRRAALDGRLRPSGFGEPGRIAAEEDRGGRGFGSGASPSGRGSRTSDLGLRTSDDPILSMLTARQARLASVRHALTRYDTTAFVLVLIPERLSIEESARAVHDLDHAHLHVAAAIVNRVLPDGLSGEYLEARRSQERVYLDEIDRRFRAVPRAVVPLLEADVHGIAGLERIAREMAL